MFARNLDGRKHDKENTLKNGLGSVTSKPADIQSVPIQKTLSCDSQQNEKGHLQTYRWKVEILRFCFMFSSYSNVLIRLYRQYKESLRQQRTVDGVYKCPQKEVPNFVKPAVVVELAPVSWLQSLFACTWVMWF